MAVLGWAAGYLLVGGISEGATTPEEIAQEAAAQTILGGFISGIFVILALIGTGVSYWFSDQIISKMVNARPANPGVYIEKYFIDTVEGLVLACGLPAIPKAYIIDSPALNAFATGRDPQHSLIAVTTGLLEQLDRQELEGVIAHEMSHIYNRDILLMGVAAVLVGGISMFSHFMLRLLFWGGGGDRRDSKGGGCGVIGLVVALVFLILAPIFANLLNMLLSRKREFLADATAVQLTRNPEGLMSALNKISNSPEKMPFVEKELSALFIDHPQKHKPTRGFWANALSTHPPVEDRVQALKYM
ncbi:M48 family metallopeptidase [bacterium]|nr:M48 family metallopeptidase [bacterium]